MKGLLGFAAGLVVGAVAGIYLAKDKIMSDAKQEIEEVREYYKNKKAEQNETVEAINVELKEPKELNDKVEAEMKEIGKEISKKYTNYSNIENIENVQITEQYDAPYIIDYEEFGNDGAYDTDTLTYFADGVLADITDEKIDEDEVPDMVGLDNLAIFKETEATTIFVRNDYMCTDYEIIKDDWNWSDIQGNTPEKKPHQL